MKVRIVKLLIFGVAFLHFYSSKSQDMYEYKIRSGSESWHKAKNHQELREVCQIPPEVIQKMSTDLLIKSVLNYPLMDNKQINIEI